MVKNIQNEAKNSLRDTRHLHSVYPLQHTNIGFLFCFVLYKTQKNCPLSVPMFDVTRSLGSSSGPH